MNTCKNCGAPISDGASSCTVCGAAANIPETPQVVSKPSIGSKKRRLPIAAAIVIVVLVLLFAVSRCGGTPKQTVDWPTGALAQMIPSMNRPCEAAYEHADSLSISVSDGIARTDYDAYLNECKERGFTVDAIDTGSNYTAYNTDGFQLALSFQDHDGASMSIDLEAPKANGTLSWPTTGLATLIPDPGKSKGAVEIDSSDQLLAYVGETSESDYSAYVEECIKQGFGVDYDKGDKTFSAKNEAGDSLRLEYEGFDTMSISIYAAKSTETAQSNEQQDSAAGPSTGKESSEQTPEPVEDTASDLKSTMDSYEEFMDGYIAFMQKYGNAGNPVDMAADYAKMMEDYAEIVAKIEAIDEQSLSGEDYQYYIEVTTRVNKKLLEATV